MFPDKPSFHIASCYQLWNDICQKAAVNRNLLTRVRYLNAGWVALNFIRVDSAYKHLTRSQSLRLCGVAHIYLVLFCKIYYSVPVRHRTHKHFWCYIVDTDHRKNGSFGDLRIKEGKMERRMPLEANSKNVRRNHLLAALPDDEYERVIKHLEPVSLPLGKVLYESGDKLDYVYFPTTAIVSLLYIMENGATAEIGVVGNDGVLGIALFMGGDTTPNRAVIQSAGYAFKMSAKELKAEFTLGRTFHNLLLRYTQALITQISQTAVCNRLHTVEQQLCRWLLLSHDRLDSDELVMTHDLISNMLGVRREGVTLAAQKLGAQKLIRSVRGTMTIIDRQGLENAVCECYKVVNEEYTRLLGLGLSRTLR